MQKKITLSYLFIYGRLLKTSNEHLFVYISDNEFVIKAG